MTDGDLTPEINVTQEWWDAPDRMLEWMDMWHLAWEALEACHLLDALGSAEYRRLTSEAWLAMLPPCQTAMRQWIYRRLQAATVDSITQLSLQRRERERNQKSTKGAQHARNIHRR